MKKAILKTQLRIWTAAALMITAMTVVGRPVRADEAAPLQFTGAQAQVNFTTEFTNQTPNKALTYSVTNGAAVPAQNGSPEIKEGYQGHRVLVNGTAQKGTSTFTSGTGASQNQVTLDFSAITFPELGIYRYIIQQSGTPAKESGSGITYDVRPDGTVGNGLRYLDVAVYLDESGNNTISYALHSDDGAQKTTDAEPAKLVDKSTGYANTYENHNLSIQKVIAGDQADPSEYFQVTVKVEQEQSQTALPVDITKAPGDGSAHINASTINITNGTGEQAFYLKGGEQIVIHGISWGASYTVKEDKAAMDLEGYTVTATVAGNDTSSQGSAIAMDQADDSVKDLDFTDEAAVTFTNTKNGTIPTGIAMSILPGLIIVGIGIAGIVYILRKRR